MDCTTIIPIHKLSEKDYPFLKDALQSLVNQTFNKFNTMIVVTPDINLSEVKTFCKKEIEQLNNCTFYVKKTEGTTYQEMINFGVENTTTKHFTVLELDDKLQSYYYETASKWIKEYDDVNVFLPYIINLKYSEDGNHKYAGLQNSVATAQNVMTERGVLDLDSVLKNNIIELTGAIFTKDDFVEIGGYKKTIEHYFNYELLLRILKYGQKIFVIPKVGVLHMNFRPNSYSEKFINNVEQGQIDKTKWYNIALKEYFFKIERDNV